MSKYKRVLLKLSGEALAGDKGTGFDEATCVPVAIPAPKLPKYLIASEVASEEAERLTILFPIRIAESIFPESSVTRRTLSARLSPDSARVRIRILLTVVKAVSAEEKKAESIKSTTKNINCGISLGPNKIHLIYFL